MCWFPGLGHRNTVYVELPPLLLASSPTPGLYFAGDTLLLFASDRCLHHTWYADVCLGSISPAVPARPSPGSPRPEPYVGVYFHSLQLERWREAQKTKVKGISNLHSGEMDDLEYAHVRTCPHHCLALSSGVMPSKGGKGWDLESSVLSTLDVLCDSEPVKWPLLASAALTPSSLSLLFSRIQLLAGGLKYRADAPQMELKERPLALTPAYFLPRKLLLIHQDPSHISPLQSVSPVTQKLPGAFHISLHHSMEFCLLSQLPLRASAFKYTVSVCHRSKPLLIVWLQCFWRVILGVN